MKAWESIETLAEEMGISRRTAYRKLKQGEIRRKREDGRMIFVLGEELIDNDTVIGGDTTQMTHGDGFDTGKKHYGRYGVPDRPVSSLVRGLEEEIQKVRLSRELGKERAATNEWQEGQDKQRREKAEEEKGQRLEELQIREGERQAAERETKVRLIIQRVKEAVLPLSMKAMFPISIMSIVYTEIEKVLSRMNLVGVPFDELIILGTDVKNRIIGQNLEPVRESVCEYLMALSRNVLRECLKQMYSDYRERGGELCYRDFILNNANSPDEREQLLNLIAL